MKNESSIHRQPVWLLLVICTALTNACGDDPEDTKGNEVPPLSTVPSSSGSGSTPDSAEPSADKLNRQTDKATADIRTDPAAFLTAARTAVTEAPFQISVTRGYFKGSCGIGDVPEKRKDAEGIRAVLEGTLTYKGTDMLIDARVDGALFLHVGKTRYATAPAFTVTDRPTPGRKSTSAPAEITRAVRGEDPWLSNQTRPFHFETEPLNPGFCEIIPESATIYMELHVEGIRDGAARLPLLLFSPDWTEVIGMALSQQISVKKATGGKVPADAHFARLNSALITRLSGETVWIDREDTIVEAPLKKASGTTFPAKGVTSEWEVQVQGILDAREFGGYSPKGEDQFLAVLDLEIHNRSQDDAAPTDLEFRMETTPNNWVPPVNTSLGQMNTTAVVGAKKSVRGKLVFPRQRFERPIRLEIKSPDGPPLYIDVFSYQMGPNRSPLKKAP